MERRKIGKGERRSPLPEIEIRVVENEFTVNSRLGSSADRVITLASGIVSGLKEIEGRYILVSSNRLLARRNKRRPWLWVEKLLLGNGLKGTSR